MGDELDTQVQFELGNGGVQFPQFGNIFFPNFPIVDGDHVERGNPVVGQMQGSYNVGKIGRIRSVQEEMGQVR